MDAVRFDLRFKIALDLPVDHPGFHPSSALSWLGRSPAAPTFRALLRGEISIDHAALDEHDIGQATAYLRAWLVGHGVLEQRDERLTRFERWANATLAGVAEHPDRAHLVAYARWRLGPTSRAGSAPARHFRRATAGPTPSCSRRFTSRRGCMTAAARLKSCASRSSMSGLPPPRAARSRPATSSTGPTAPGSSQSWRSGAPRRRQARLRSIRRRPTASPRATRE